MERSYSLPIGVSPMGLTGMQWPGAAEFLAATAQRQKIPFVLSTFATTRMERIAEIAPDAAWFQLYVLTEPAIEADLIARAQRSGYDVLVVTIDVPTATRRQRDIRNGLSVPPRIDVTTLLQILGRPKWALSTLRWGIPEFLNLKPYFPTNMSLADLGEYISRLTEGHVSLERLKEIRDSWPGKLVVKGVLHPADAEACRQIGADAIIVSNHGGRQLDAVPAAIDVLDDVKRACGDAMPVMVDGGIMSGLDIARALSRGADFVLIGRAFILGIAALGQDGGNHVVRLLREELRSTMGQLGCSRLADLPSFVWKQPEHALTDTL
jgi:L-lactate dehydrogenase (cytochrome)